MNKRFALLGIASVLLSSCTIVGMAALRTDGYSHLTKAVSELGSLDAPNKWWFNGLAYIIPGLLIAGFSYGLSQAFADSMRRKMPFLLLALSGLLLTLAGVFPIDMDRRNSPASVLHTVVALGSGVAWLGCALTIGWPLRRHQAWTNLRRQLGWLVGLAVALIVFVGIVSPSTPGLGQRISFMAYFLFILLLARQLRLVAQPDHPALEHHRNEAA